MKLRKFSGLLLALLFLFSCSEDGPEELIEVSIQDLNVTVGENPDSGTVLGTIMATTSSGTISYSLSNESVSGAFEVNSSNGEVSVNDASLFDFETVQNLEATITATVDEVSKSAALTVTLTDALDPTITAENLETSMSENPLNGTVIGVINGSSDQGTITYSLNEDSNSAAFLLNTTTGELSVKDSTFFDYETNPSMSATVYLTVGEVSELVTATIMLENVNEITAPEFFEYEMDENPDADQELFFVSANAEIGDVTLTLVEESVEGAFKIGEAQAGGSAYLLVNDASLFDYESDTTLSGKIEISATDAVSKVFDFVITLNDVDETSSLLPEAIIYMPLDDLDISNANSSVSNSLFGFDFDGEITNPTGESQPVSTSDRFGNSGKAFSTGNKNGFTIPDWNQLSKNTGHDGSFTIALWVRVVEATGNRMTRPIWETGCGQSPAIGVFMVNEINSNAGKVYLRQGSPSGTASASYSNPVLTSVGQNNSQWFFVAVSYISSPKGNSLIYRIFGADGTRYANTTLVTEEVLYEAATASDENPITFGLRSCSSTINIPMELDDVVIFDRFLSADELDALQEELDQR